MSEISPATGKLLALSMLKGVGPATLRKIYGLNNFDSLSNDLIAEQIPHIADVVSNRIAWSQALDLAEKQVEIAETCGARILSPADRDYPTLLAATKDDPFLLFVRGALAPSEHKSVAVVGTRKPTAHGAVITQRLTYYFVEKGWSVVSGLALGCDAGAHQAALEKRGHTVAVLAHGLHTVAPKSHRKLAEDILESGGALVSEYRFGVEPQPQFFVKRDKIQAGMAQGVVMVQSDIQGGSLHASRASLEYGRWLAVPYPTEKDLANHEPKIQANLVIADGSMKERADLLRCPVQALDQIIVLRTRDDYGSMISHLKEPKHTRLPVQSGLL